MIVLLSHIISTQNNYDHEYHGDVDKCDKNNKSTYNQNTTTDKMNMEKMIITRIITTIEVVKAVRIIRILTIVVIAVI